MGFEYDFSGYVTRNDILCSDGKTIKQDAFKDQHGHKVPMVWGHVHNDPSLVIGHTLLENRSDGVYGYCKLNNTRRGRDAKELVNNGDVDAFSIWANNLKMNAMDVVHGTIREVSLVLAGANPGAHIDTVISHSDEEIEGIAIYTDETINLEHGVFEEKEEVKETENMDDEHIEHAQDKSITELFDEAVESMDEEHRQAVMAVIGMAAQINNKEGNEEMKHNAFDNQQDNDVLAHSEEIQKAINDGKRYGSMKESFIAHGVENIEYIAHAEGDYGITNIDYLFPEAKAITNEPDFIKREDAWVSEVMNSVSRTPFARIKSIHANITADEARAKGYVKGNKKIEEVFPLLKRITGPTTVYKKQKLDRDDLVDITSIDVIGYMKGEMHGMLNEELARGILVGDGRSVSDQDKINEQCIRPIWTDDDLYTVKVEMQRQLTDTAESRAKALIKLVNKKRKLYKGSGSPVFYTTEDILADMLLIEDVNGRVIYDSEEKLAKALRVRKIVTVPVFENLTRTVGSNTHELMAILVNLRDYNVGGDKDGNVNMFDDFDIDYNQMKYLIETRRSGALVKAYAAQAFEYVYPTE